MTRVLPIKEIVETQVGIAFDVLKDLVETATLLKDSSGSSYDITTGEVVDTDPDIQIEGIFIDGSIGNKNLYVQNLVGAQGEGYQFLVQNKNNIYNDMFVNDTLVREGGSRWIIINVALDPTSNFITAYLERKR